MPTRFAGFRHSRPDEPTEEYVAPAIKKPTIRRPADPLLWAALGCLGLSLASWLIGRRDLGVFLGQLAPMLLTFGLYNRAVRRSPSEELYG